jgi:hypothetical protein
VELINEKLKSTLVSKVIRTNAVRAGDALMQIMPKQLPKFVQKKIMKNC